MSEIVDLNTLQYDWMFLRYAFRCRLRLTEWAEHVAEDGRFMFEAASPEPEAHILDLMSKMDETLR